jgi:hypothetical protein
MAARARSRISIANKMAFLIALVVISFGGFILVVQGSLARIQAESGRIQDFYGVLSRLSARAATTANAVQLEMNKALRVAGGKAPADGVEAAAKELDNALIACKSAFGNLLMMNVEREEEQAALTGIAKAFASYSASAADVAAAVRAELPKALALMAKAEAE